MPAANARRMNSRLKHGRGRGRASGPGSARGGPSKTIPPRTSTSRSTTSLDRAELVRDVEDRDAELARAARRAARRATPATSASTPAVGSSRTSSVGSPASALAMNARCCWPPESVRSGDVAPGRPARRARSPRSTTLAVAAAAAGRTARARRAARRDDLAHRHRRLDAELRALRQVADAAALGERRPAGSPKSAHRPRASAARGRATSRRSVVLPPPFGPAIATNSPALDAEVDVPQDGRPGRVGERDAVAAQLDG